LAPPLGRLWKPAAKAGGIGFATARKTTTMAQGTTLLQAAQTAGVRARSSCRQGVCGTCRVKLLSGSVDMQHQGGIKPREIDQGYVLACCSRPTSDVEVAM